MKALQNQIINQLNIADDFYEAYQRRFETDKNDYAVAFSGLVCCLFAAGNVNLNLPKIGI